MSNKATYRTFFFDAAKILDKKFRREKILANQELDQTLHVGRFVAKRTVSTVCGRIGGSDGHVVVEPGVAKKGWSFSRVSV